MTPERARRDIDRLLTAAGWHVCDFADASIHAARGVAIREFELEKRRGIAGAATEVIATGAGSSPLRV